MTARPRVNWHGNELEPIRQTPVHCPRIEVYTWKNGLRIIEDRKWYGIEVSIPWRRLPWIRRKRFLRHTLGNLLMNAGGGWCLSVDEHGNTVDAEGLWRFSARQDERAVKLITGPDGAIPWRIALLSQVEGATIPDTMPACPDSYSPEEHRRNIARCRPWLNIRHRT